MHPHTLPVIDTPFHAFYGQERRVFTPYPSAPYYTSFYTPIQQPTDLTLPQQTYWHHAIFPASTLYPQLLYRTTRTLSSSAVTDPQADFTSTAFNDGHTGRGNRDQGLQSRRPRYKDMVEVYNADIFIKKVPLKLLIRFSRKAAEALPPTACVPPSEACHHTPKPPRAIDLSTGRPIPRRLYLYVDAPENPTHFAVGTVIKWMLDNEDTPREATLMTFGPPRLHEVDLISLLDLYQAVLAFGVRPFPSRLKHEIQKRVSDIAPTPEMFKQFAKYIPAQDPVMVRLLTSHYDWYWEGHYSIQEVEEISEVIASRQDLGMKWREIFRVRECRRKRQLMAQEKASLEGSGHRASIDSQDIEENEDSNDDAALENTVGEHSITPSQVSQETFEAKIGCEESSDSLGHPPNGHEQQARK